MRADPLVELVDVHRHHRRGDEVVRALDGVSLVVARGEMVALVGPSGCGKSSTLDVVAAADVADAGRVIVCGRDLARASERELTRLRRESVGVVFQAFHLVANLTVDENVALPLALAGRRDPERVLAIVERVGLAHRRRHYPAQLSGGEQQRTALARALVHGPELLVADEPTGNLDSASGGMVLELMDELRREHGTALLLATHDERIARRADRVVEMRDGRIVGSSAR